VQAYRYIEERAPDAAVRWYQQVKAAIQSLSRLPSRCPLAPEGEKLGCELRQLHYGKRPRAYRIVFHIVEAVGEVDILTVRHAARQPLTDDDLRALLADLRMDIDI